MRKRNPRSEIKRYSFLISIATVFKRVSLFIVLVVSTSCFCQKLGVGYGILKSDFNNKNILLHLFNGTYAAEKECVSWKPTQGEITLKSDNDSSYTFLEAIHTYKTGNGLYSVVVLNTVQYIDGIGQTCHGCTPSELGLALLKENGDKWELLKFQPAINQIGYSGMLPQASIIELGNEKFGIHFKVEDHQVNMESNLGYIYSVDSSSFSRTVLTYMQNNVIEYNDQPLIEEGTINVLNTENDYFDLQLILETRRYSDNGFQIIKTRSVTYRCTDSNWHFLEAKDK